MRILSSWRLVSSLRRGSCIHLVKGVCHWGGASSNLVLDLRRFSESFEGTLREGRKLVQRFDEGEKARVFVDV